jgi:hypothetical protein
MFTEVTPTFVNSMNSAETPGGDSDPWYMYSVIRICAVAVGDQAAMAKPGIAATIRNDISPHLKFRLIP